MNGNNAKSYSNINTFRACQRKYYYRSILGIQKKKWSKALRLGIEGHEILKTFFLALQQGGTLESARAAAEAFANERMEEIAEITFEDEMLDARKEVEVIWWIIEQYIERYASDWTILHVEEEFIIQLTNGAVITFTPDLVVRDRNGAVWIVDHKTTSSLPKAGIPFGDTQALLYSAGVKSLYPELAGFVFNRMRKKIPTQPRLTKTGKTRVAELKRIDTTYEILRDFIKQNAPGLMADPAHQRRLAELRDGPDRFFWTETIYYNENVTTEILKDTASTYEQLVRQEAVMEFPRTMREDRGWNSCSRCAYQEICHAELVGWDTAHLLEEVYEEADPKNPYEGEYDGEDREV